jgi:DNA-binding beta-propeller fold protein YncE
VGELPVELALSPDEKYLIVANYIGEVQELSPKQKVTNGTLAIIDADRDSSTFGRTLAKIKNLELKE